MKKAVVGGLVLFVTLFMIAPSHCQLRKCDEPSQEKYCLNGGTCYLSSNNQTRCICQSAFTGPYCRTRTIEYYGVDHLWVSNMNRTVQHLHKVGPKALSPGQHLTLSCQLLSNPRGFYRVDWSINGTMINSSSDPGVYINHTSSDGTLFISNPSRDRNRYEGFYYCLVSSDLGVARGPTIEVKIKVLGTFFGNSPITYNVTVNTSLVLKCPPHSYAYGVYYTWNNASARNQINFDKNRVALDASDGTLYFAQVTDQDVIDAKGIQCRMMLSERLVRYSNVVTLKKTGTGRITAPGSFNFPTSDVNMVVTRGETTVLNCFPYGIPPISVIWYKNSKQIASSAEFSLLSSNRTLQILIRNKGSVGNYTAIVKDGLSQVKQFANIKLHYLDLITSNMVFVQNKGTVTFDCSKLIGVSFPSTWYYDGKPISSQKSRFDSRSKLHLNGSLTLQSLVISDIGLYQCFIDGKDASTYPMYVAGAPLPPISLAVTNCSRWTTTLAWGVKRSPLIEPSSFIVEMKSQFTPNAYTKLQDVSGGSTRKLDMKNLSPGATLWFRMRGRNDLGVGLPSQPSPQCITLPGKPTTVPEGLQAITNKASGSMNVTWKLFPRINWNGDKCNIRVYAKRNDLTDWSLKSKLSCYDTVATLSSLGNYQLTDIKIQVENQHGTGPNSTTVTAYSGQNPPTKPPSALRVIGLTPYSVSLQWNKIVIKNGSVDEYWVSYRVVFEEDGGLSRRRRAIGTSMWQKFLSWILPRRRFRRALLNPPPPNVVKVKQTNVTINALQSYTRYTFLVQAVNSGGYGPVARFTAKTLDKLDSFFILSITVVSENFTAEYEDKTSIKYRNLHNTITTGLKVVTSRIFWIRSFEVLSFRNGSVVADVQLVSVSPTGSDFRDALIKDLSRGYFKPYVIDQSKLNITKEPGFSTPNISVSNLSPSPDDTIEFKCTSTGGPRAPSYHWAKDKTLLSPGVRHKIVSDEKQSILTIRKIDPIDEGDYQCIVRKANHTSPSEPLVVKVKPVIAIVPRSLTKVEGESATFSCQVVSGDISSMKLVVVEPGPTPTVISVNTSTFDNLTISNGNTIQTVTYQCLLVLNDLKNPVAKSQQAKLTIVKPSFPKCTQETASKVEWSSTAVGGTNVQLCPGNATGQATRRCIEGSDSKPTWSDPNLGNCTSIEFNKLLLQAEAIISNDYSPSYNASGLLQVLKNATISPAKKESRLNGGDLDVTVTILSILVNNNNTVITSDEDQQNFLDVCSNILEPTNTQSWIQYEDQQEKETKLLWNRLVVTIDRYGLQLANQIAGATKLIRTTNIVMRLDKVSQQNEIKKTGLHFAYKDFQSFLFLPAEVFSDDTENRVVSLVYKTLNSVMRLHKNDTNTTQADVLPSNTTMVTSVVRPAPIGKLKEKVKIVVKNKRDVEPVPPQTCVFWREGLPSTWSTDGCSLVPSESNKDVTTCECDHLTVFAALMDPYGGPIPEGHRKALELISTIGCSISLFAVLLTIVVTMFFWKTLKAPRTIVLMNICVAIAVVCGLVIAEGTTRDTKVGCTVMAVLLHYFLLAVFCWMLCEGVLLYLLIVKVIGAEVEEKVKFFLLFGWGFPLIIVGISLAVTQTQGYGYYGDQTACWLAVDNGLIWAFIAPAIVVLLINMVVFILVIRQMLGTRHVQSKSRDEKIRMGVKATAVVLPLLGITWVFGLLAFNSATLAFKYVFAILNSLQGLMIFIFHCILNQQIQDAVKRKFNQYSSSDSTGMPKSRSSPGKKRKGFTRGTDIPSEKSENAYEMNRRKKDSKCEELIHSLSDLPSNSDVVSPQNVKMQNVDEIQNNEPKQDINNERYSPNEPTYSEIYDDQSPPYHNYDNIVQCINAGNHDNTLAEERHLDNANQKDDDQETTFDQVNRDNNRSSSPMESSSPPMERDSPPMERDSPPMERDSPPMERGSPPMERGSPPMERSSPPLEPDNQPGLSFLNQAFEKDEFPVSTRSSFDFGAPLSIYSAGSQRSSISEDSSNDDEDSVCSYTVTVANPTQPTERINSDSSTDTMVGEDEFKCYLEQTDSVPKQPLADGRHGFQVDSDSSSTSDDEVMIYDLIFDKENEEDNQQGVLFLGQKNITESVI